MLRIPKTTEQSTGKSVVSECMTLCWVAHNYPQPHVAVHALQGTTGHVSVVFFLIWVVFLRVFALQTCYLRVGEMAQSARWWWCTCGDLSLNLQHLASMSCLTICTCNPSTMGFETERSLELSGRHWTGWLELRQPKWTTGPMRNYASKLKERPFWISGFHMCLHICEHTWTPTWKHNVCTQIHIELSLRVLYLYVVSTVETYFQNWGVCTSL